MLNHNTCVPVIRLPHSESYNKQKKDGKAHKGMLPIEHESSSHVLFMYYFLIKALYH